MEKGGMFCWRYEENIAIVVIDQPGTSVNLLTKDFAPAFNRMWDEFENKAAEEGLAGVIFTSGKQSSFIAGADVQMIRDCRDSGEAGEISHAAQKAFQRISDFSKPVVAAVHGGCMGGGLELALACDFRIASDDADTKFALPEIKLGLIPGGGGTVRLPRLIGLQESLDMMLTGKSITAEEAVKKHLVSEVVQKEILISVAKNYVQRGKKAAPEHHQGFNDWAKQKVVEGTPIGRNIVFSQARKKSLEKTHGLIPAHNRMLDVLERIHSEGESDPYRHEREVFAGLAMTWQSKNLQSIFLDEKKLAGENRKLSSEAASFENVAVVGAGLMGAGIAYVTASETDAAVRLKDVAEDKAGEALATIDNLFRKSVRTHRLTEFEADKRFLAVTPSVDYSGFRKVSLVIEAVFEDIGLKQKILSECQEKAESGFIFASNTSALPLSRIAEGSDMDERVIGMHYFSPVEKMPLLEIIRSSRTSEDVLARCVRFGLEQGKKVVVVRDRPGFYTTRVLTAFLAEAFQCLKDGADIEMIDETIEQTGFPMGPFKLVDEVGIAVTHKIATFMESEFGESFSTGLDPGKLTERGIEGQKSGAGFYHYKNGEPKGVNEEAVSLIGLPRERRSVGANAVRSRCLQRFLREAALCLQEEIIAGPRDGDLAAVFGLGFPPFEGGPFRMIDRLGAASVRKDMEHLAGQFGPRFNPPEIVCEQEKSGEKFYDRNRPGEASAGSSQRA